MGSTHHLTSDVVNTASGQFQDGRAAAGCDLLRGPVGDGGAGSQGFDAAQFAASAARAAIVDGVVTALGCGSRATVIDAVVENNAGADSGADGGVENVSITAPSTPYGFRQSRCVAVIVDTNRQAISLRH